MSQSDLSAIVETLQQVSSTVTKLADTVDALRSIALVISYSIARQPSIDKAQFLADFKTAVDSCYPQDAPIPIVVSDTLAQVHRAIKGD